MKTTRLALIITFTPPEDVVITDATTPDDLKLMLFDAANANSAKGFIENVAIWQTMKGSIEEDEQLDDSINKLDRSIIHQMSVDQARVIMTSRATVEALMMTFAQLSSTAIKNGDPVNSVSNENKNEGDTSH